MTIYLRHDRLPGSGIQLHAVRVGFGPPVILLHGFPQYWTSWRHQLPALAEAGFEAIAVDMRGYNLSDRPPEMNDYDIRLLVADVREIIKATGYKRAHLVGHDWGGIIAWTFAGTYPELVDKLVVMGAPHLELYRRNAGIRQTLRSWYVAFFSLPRVSERALRAGNFRAVRKLFTDSDAFSAEEIDDYIAVLSQEGALTAGMNYYRALMRKRDAREFARAGRVRAETLVIWGERDSALRLDLLEGIEEVAPRARVHTIPGASHWMQSDSAEEVNRLLIEFLTP